MRSANIIISSNPKGVFLAGLAGDASKPGTIMQVKAATPMVGTKHTFVAAAPGTDGFEVMPAILMDDQKNGFLATQATAIGQEIQMYVPLSGEDVNVLVGEVAGTANTYAIGDRLIVDAEDGILVPETGTPQATLFVMMEALVQVVGSTLAWVRKI